MNNQMSPAQMMMSYTPQQLAQMYNEQQLRQIFTPQQLATLFTLPPQQQQMGMQPMGVGAQPQSMFGYNQQQGYIQQPQQNQCFTNMTANTPFNANGVRQQTTQVNVGTRYDNVTSNNNFNYVEQPNAVATQPEKLPEPKPLPGNEYEPLLISGMTADKEIIGGYFKYIYNGVPKMSTEIEKLKVYKQDDSWIISNDDIRKIPVVNTATKFLKRMSIDEDVNNIALDMLNSVENIVTKKVNPLYYVSLISKNDDFISIGNDLRLLINDPSCDPIDKNFYLAIDKYLVDKINTVFKSKLGSNISITSYIDDIGDLIKHVETGVDAESSTKYKANLDKLLKTLKYDASNSECVIDSDTESGAKTNIAYIPEILAVCYTKNKVIKDSISNMKKGVIYSIAKHSHPVLFKLFGSMYKNTIMSIGSSGIISTDNDSAFVESSLNGYFTIRKY